MGKKKTRNTFKRLANSTREPKTCKHRWALVAPYLWQCKLCKRLKDESSLPTRDEFWEGRGEN